VTGQRLRDLRMNTELLILVEIMESPTARLKTIGDRLGVTVQAISQYISKMKKEGLLKEHSGRMAPTRKGMQLLQEHFSSLKEEIDSVLRKIRVIETCEAIAGGPVKKGQAVGLLMEDGMLIAYPATDSPSRGVALEPAQQGDDVLIGQLEGIVDLDLGELLVIEVPSGADGGSKSASVERVRTKLDEFSAGHLSAGDVSASALLSKATEEFFSVHAPIESSLSALSKGVDVVFAGTRESVDGMLDAVAELKKETGYEIKWRVYKA